MVIGFTVAAAAMAGRGIIISAQKMFASPRSRKYVHNDVVDDDDDEDDEEEDDVVVVVVVEDEDEDGLQLGLQRSHVGL